MSSPGAATGYESLAKVLLPLSSHPIQAAIRAARAAYRHELPPRYQQDWQAPFLERAIGVARLPGAQILDVGSGRRPVLTPEQRGPGSCYVGLDISAEELGLAPEGGYDEIVIADAAVPAPQLSDRFDLVLSWQVLEHVSDVGATLEHMRSALRDGGRMVGLFSGGRALYALVNRALPPALGTALGAAASRRARGTAFPAHYDRCTASALQPLLARWSSAEVLPLYRAANYLESVRLLHALYVGYEEWASDGGHADLATHYLVCAER